MSGLGMVAPILPHIRDWQGGNYTAMGFFVSSFALTRMIVDLPAGMMVDKWGSKLITVLGMVITFSGSLLSAVAPSFILLTIGRMLAGVGSGMTVASLQTELMLLVSVPYRSRAMSYFMLARRGGASLFPLLGGLLADTLGWRSVFYFCALLNIVGVVISISVPIQRTEKGGDNREDGKEEGPKEASLPSDYSLKTIVSLTLYLLALMLFLNRNGLEKTILPLYGDTLGFDSFHIGLALTLSSLASLGAIYWGGQAADCYGRKPLLLLGLAMLILINVLFLWAGTYLQFLILNLLFGLTSFVLSLPNVIIADLVKSWRTGRALGAIRLFNDAGTVLGPIILGWAMGCYSFKVAIYMNTAMLLGTAVLALLIVPESGYRKSVF